MWNMQGFHGKTLMVIK